MSTINYKKVSSVLTILNTVDNFSKYLMKRRSELSLTQRELAKKVGVTHAIISRIESGEASDFKFSTFLGLSKALKVHPMELIQLYQGDIDEPSSLEDDAVLDGELTEAVLAVLKKRKVL